MTRTLQNTDPTPTGRQRGAWRPFWAILAVCALLFAALSLATHSWTLSDPTAPVPSPAVSDDEPRWNCVTQGNHMCGVQDSTTGAWYVVTFKDGAPTDVASRP